MWWYLSSVIIYYCILEASMKLCVWLLNKNGRAEKIKQLYKKEGNSISSLIICCIPIIRLLVLIMLYWLVFCDDKYFNKIINDNFNKD